MPDLPTNSTEELSTVPLVIDGQDRFSDDLQDVVNPKDGRVIHHYVNATVADAQSAVDAAARAFESWSKTRPPQRRDIFLKAVEVLERRWAELSGYILQEIGCDESFAEFNFGIVKGYLLDCAGRVNAPEGVVPATQSEEYQALTIKEPYGVVLALAPWNAPFILGFRAVIWPIAAGNTVVFKGSELSPRCLWAVSSVLHEAGLPAGVLNYIVCHASNAPNVTEAIISSPHVKKINFTGSTAVGRIIAKMAGEHLKPVLLELGGKGPAIVCDDADINLAAQQCAIGAFLYSGQICMSTERILVHKSVQVAFEQALSACVDQMFPRTAKAPLLILSRAVTRNKSLVENALAKGAVLINNWKKPSDGDMSMRPAILSNVTKDMEIYKQESFGPSVSIIGIDTDEEALRIANDTEYGLSASIYSRDLRRALRLAKQIETGAVHINRMTIQDEPVMPHGGAKASGFGRFGAGLNEWLRTKNITYDF